MEMPLPNPGVAEVIVSALEDLAGQKRAHAFLVPTGVRNAVDARGLDRDPVDCEAARRRIVVNRPCGNHRQPIEDEELARAARKRRRDGSGRRRDGLSPNRRRAAERSQPGTRRDVRNEGSRRSGCGRRDRNTPRGVKLPVGRVHHDEALLRNRRYLSLGVKRVEPGQQGNRSCRDAQVTEKTPSSHRWLTHVAPHCSFIRSRKTSVCVVPTNTDARLSPDATNV